MAEPPEVTTIDSHASPIVQNSNYPSKKKLMASKVDQIYSQPVSSNRLVTDEESSTNNERPGIGRTAMTNFSKA